VRVIPGQAGRRVSEVLTLSPMTRSLRLMRDCLIERE
jgi:hypothetical protein